MAGLIPQDFIDELLSRADLSEVVGNRVALKKAGREYKGCCPFHNEKTPSFTVSPDKGFYHCFGCGAHGSAIRFLMDHDKMEFVEAIEELAQMVGVDVPRDTSSNEQPVQSNAPLYDLLGEVAKFYQQQLKQSPVAVDYLKARGLDGETAQRFLIGFAPPGWDSLLKHLGEKSTNREYLLTTGMLIRKDDRVYDRFRERVQFPIRDSRGRVIGFGGRTLDGSEPKYLNSPETPVFHKGRELYGLYEARQMLRNIDQLLVVEGYMDVISLSQHGVHNAVATLGTATTPDHLKRLFRITQEVVFCFDGDAAGLKAADRAMHTCLPYMQDGRQARFLLLPDGEDPDSLVRQEGNDKLTARIVDATPLSDFLFQRLGQDLDPHNLEHRAKLATDASPLIAIIPKGIMRSMMHARLSKITGLDKDTLAELSALKVPTPATHSEPNPTPAANTQASTSSQAPNTGPAGDSDQNSTHDYADYHITEANPDIADNIQHWHDEHPHAQPSEDPSLLLRQNFSAVLPKVQNPAHAAIRIILRHPEVVEHVDEIPSHLAELKMQDAGVLTQLLNTVQAMHKALKRWPNPAELHIECATWDAWPMLRQLAAMESLLPQGNYPQQLDEAISRLLGHHFDERFNQLIHLASQPNADANTKKQLKDLLKEKEELQNRLKSRQ